MALRKLLRRGLIGTTTCRLLVQHQKHSSRTRRSVLPNGLLDGRLFCIFIHRHLWGECPHLPQTERRAGWSYSWPPCPRRFRGNHRKRKVVKPAGVNVAVPLVRGLPGCAGRMLRMVTGGGAGVAAGMADGRAGRACPAAVLRVLRGSVPGARVSCRAVRLYVVINRVLPGAAARPGSRQRAIELVQGAAGLPMVSGELMALRPSGLVPPPGGKLTGSPGLPRGGYLMRPPGWRRRCAGARSARRRCGHPTSCGW